MTYDPTPAGAPESFTPAAPEQTAIPTTPVGATAVTSPAAAIAVPKKSSGGRLLNAVLVVAVAVAIGGVAFAVGRSTAPASAAVVAGGRVNQGVVVGPGGSFVPGANGGGFGGRGGLGGGLTVSGEVVSIDGDTMTIKTASGQTIQVKTGDGTTYHSQTPATASDVVAGSKVQVQLELNGQGGAARPGASGAPSGPSGTAGSVTVIP